MFYILKPIISCLRLDNQIDTNFESIQIIFSIFSQYTIWLPIAPAQQQQQQRQQVHSTETHTQKLRGTTRAIVMFFFTTAVAYYIVVYYNNI